MFSWDEDECKLDFSLRNIFKNGRIPILLEVTLRDGGPQVGHTIRCSVIDSENMKWFIGAEHKNFSFIVQMTAIDYSLGVSIDQFGYDVLWISKYQNLLIVFILKDLQNLEESQPLYFIVSSSP